jgi:hypothetical protein
MLFHLFVAIEQFVVLHGGVANTASMVCVTN